MLALSVPFVLILRTLPDIGVVRRRCASTKLRFTSACLALAGNHFRLRSYRCRAALIHSDVAKAANCFVYYAGGACGRPTSVASRIDDHSFRAGAAQRLSRNENKHSRVLIEARSIEHTLAKQPSQPLLACCEALCARSGNLVSCSFKSGRCCHTP